MNNYSFSSASGTAWVPALVFGLGGLAVMPSLAEAQPALMPRFEASMTSTSYRGTHGLVIAPISISFEERLSRFYNQLTASQADIDFDLQEILAANISSLYED